MKKTICSLLVLLSFLANGENLFRNGDFEKVQGGKPSMWGGILRNNNFAKIDTQDAISGKNSVKIVVPAGKEGPFLFNQRRKVKVPANTPIKLSGWFKSENYRTVKGKKAKRGIYTSIIFADKSRAYPTIAIRPTYGKWQYKELFYTYPKEIIAINSAYLMHYNASGTIKYDNVYFGPWTKSDKQTASKPLVLIPKIKKQPRLDGKINDFCWEKAAKISNFVIFNKNKFAKNPTEVYIAYDKKNFYIATRCFSSILDPALQMLDKFSAKETSRDGSVFRDDSIEIFISRPDGNYFQFAYNALGTQYDGEKLEKGWNCNWKVKAQIHDGAWEAEMVIPLEAIGIKPEEGGKFGINVCRNDRAEKEASTWSKCETGFHDVDKFGIGMFGRETLQMSTGKLPGGLINLGRQKFDFTVTNPNAASAKAMVTVELITNSARSLYKKNKELKQNEKSKISIDANFKTIGQGKYRYILTDCSNGIELFRSPLYNFTSNVILRARNNISFGGKLELFLNGKKINGKVFSLVKGKNDIVVKCIGSGKLSDGIDILSSPKSLPETLKFQGNSDGSLELKKTIWIESTKLSLFNIKDGIHLEPGVTQLIPLQVDYPAGKELEIMIPEEIKLIDFQSTDNKRLKTKALLGSDKIINNIKYKTYKYSYTCTKPLKKLKQGVFVTMPKPSSRKFLDVYFRTKNDNYIETWQKLRINPIAFVHSRKRPRKLKIELWHSFGSAMSKQQLTKMIETFAITGFNEYVERNMCYGRDMFLKPLRDNKIRVNAEFHTGHQIHSLFRKYPNARTRNLKNKTSKRMPLKTSFLCGKGREEFKKIVRDFVLKYRPDSVLIDMEKSSTVDCDASPESLAAFAKFAKLSKIPSKEEILKKHLVQWGNFMCLSWSKIARIINEGIKSADPKAKFAIYSSYQSARNKMKYSIDWSLMRGVVDFAEMGYGRQPKNVRDETFKALGSIPSATGVLFWQKTPQKLDRTLKNKILRRITDGAKGITFYNWSRLDGLSRAKISEACAILADYEDFFLKNKHLDSFSVTGFKKDDVVLLANGKDLLLVIFNNSSRVKKGKIILKNASGMKTVRHVDGKIINTDKLELSVRPFNTAVFKISNK